MANKYLKNAEIRPNHWYIDKKGCKKLYIGLTQTEWPHPDHGCVQVDQPLYVYAKYDELERYFGTNSNYISVEEIVRAIAFERDRKLGMYTACGRHHQFVSECDVHPDAPIENGVEITNSHRWPVITFYDSKSEAKKCGIYYDDGTVRLTGDENC